MATAQTVIKRALRLLKVTQSGEEPSAEEAQDSLTALNDMLFAWELDAIPLNHIELLYTDTLPFDDNHIQPITYNLAVQLADEYGTQPTQIIYDTADNGYRNLQNFYVDPADAQTSDTLDPYYNPNWYSY